MRRVLSCGGAVALVLATVPGCGDDTTGSDSGLPDLSAHVSTDMAVSDLAMRALGNAQLTLADVAGTFYAPNGTGGESAMPFTHLLVTNQTFPTFASVPQYKDPAFSGAPGNFHGCLANRYSLLTGPFPPADEDVGLVTYAGYEAQLLASTPASITFFPAPIPSTINCQRGGASLPYYGCVFGTSTDASAGVDGTATNQVVFPALPPTAFGVGTCPPTTTSQMSGVLCEQHPFLTSGTTAITESVAGGGTYAAQPNKIIPSTGGLPNAVTVVSVNGSAPSSAADPLSGIVLDGSTDLVIKWSCDGSTTAGSGCPTGVLGLADLLGLFAVTSTNPRSAFAQTASFGSAQCAEQLGATGATVTLTRAAQQRLLMGQSGGSILLALVRLKASMPAATNGHYVFFTAGPGNFALLTH